MQTFKRYFAEFFGTMVLVLFSCGAAAVTGGSDQAAACLVTALAFGLTFAVLILCIGPVSGCHLNPAVSFARFFAGKMRGWDFLGYLVSQCFGAIAGGAVLYLILGRDSALGQNTLYAGSLWRTLAVEVILTAFFVFAVLQITESVSDVRLWSAPLGAALFLVHLFGIPFTGAGVNPARTLGVALFAGTENIACVWIFWVAALLGSVLAVLLSLFFSSKSAPAKKALSKKSASSESGAAKPAGQEEEKA